MVVSAKTADTALRISANGTSDWGASIDLASVSKDAMDPMAPTSDDLTTFQTVQVDANGDKLDATVSTVSPATFEFYVANDGPTPKDVTIAIDGVDGKLCYAVYVDDVLQATSTYNLYDGSAGTQKTNLVISQLGTTTKHVEISLWYNGHTMINADGGTTDTVNITIS